MRLDRRRLAPRVLGLAALGLIALAPGCGPVDADHPLDPDTPADRQRPSRLDGRLVAPDHPHRFDDTEATLSTDAAAPVHRSAVDAEGRFRFDAVRPGSYRLHAGDARFSTPPVRVTVPAGETLDLGDIALAPILGGVTGQVIDPEGDPVDRAWVTVADVPAALDAEGRFRATVGAGAARVEARAEGYAPATVDIDVIGNDTTALAPLVLDPEPPTLRGVVRLAAFETPLRRATARVRLLGDTATPLDEAAADPDGRFALTAPAPGEYRLAVDAPGYDPIARPVTAAPPGVDLGEVTLRHASGGPDAVYLRGTIADADGPLGEVAVEITLDPALPFARVLSARDGGFAVAVAPDEDHHLRVALAGYALVERGPYRYDPALDAVVDPDGQPPTLVLTPLP